MLHGGLVTTVRLKLGDTHIISSDADDTIYGRIRANVMLFFTSEYYYYCK